MKWVLEVGEVAVTVEGPSRWVEPFKQAWGRWSGDSSEWVVLLEEDKTLPPPRDPLFTFTPRFTDSHCFLEGQGFVGEIVPGERLARLKANPESSLDDIAYFLRTAFAFCAFETGAILFHAAGLVHRGQAFAFFGPSGSGKTTLVRLSKGKEVLSDDLLLLQRSHQLSLRGERGWEALATPFSFYRTENLSAPLQALMRLFKAEEDRLVSLPYGVALGEAVASSPIINADPLRLPKLFSRWEEIFSVVPPFALYFRKSDTLWEVIDARFGGSTEPCSWDLVPSNPR